MGGGISLPQESEMLLLSSERFCACLSRKCVQCKNQDYEVSLPHNSVYVEVTHSRFFLVRTNPRFNSHPVFKSCAKEF